MVTALADTVKYQNESAVGSCRVFYDICIDEQLFHQAFRVNVYTVGGLIYAIVGIS